jgi:hypothetical protein
MEIKNYGPVNNIVNHGGNNINTINNGTTSNPVQNQAETAVQKSSLLELVGKNDIRTALFAIHDQTTDQNIKNTCFQLIGRFSKMEFDQMGGTLSAEQENLEMNQIRMATIELINKL